eukprot:m.30121 g.30121  ORF g.30121 m.30121 type:complete len:76 (+) comp9246_c0_seq2:226-453(+)
MDHSLNTKLLEQEDQETTLSLYVVVGGGVECECNCMYGRGVSALTSFECFETASAVAFGFPFVLHGHPTCNNSFF